MTRRSPNQYNWDKLEFDETILNRNFTPMNNRQIKYIVIHHMTILNRDMGSQDALDACYATWQTREASAHYGVDGDFVRQFVWDKDVAWANGNYYANRDAIAIEHANATADQPGTENDWVIDERTFTTGAKLCAYLHRYYGITPVRGVSVRMHREFYQTACPGPYMVRNYNRYFDLMMGFYNAIGKVPEVSAPPVDPQPSAPQPPKATNSQIAHEVIKGIWGNGAERVRRLREAGYDPAAVQGMVDTLVKMQVGMRTDVVVDEVIKGIWGNGAERVANLTNAGFDPVEIQRRVNERLKNG